ncbi:hypothetical protein ACO0OL_003371 [Hanseniaspora opuntiae]|jgi:large subunit ribosomal protein L33|uniref:Large ribosomal subunit protein bL33m n=1 Tax=Hanseniaspora opuntiae TaxID=211096 RepID=A0A1E5RMM3_9ASCO|nr:hypothetical protein AWRI3578_g2296 [Hanseniaspora opuntiae]
MAPKSGHSYTAIKLVSQALTGATKTMYVKKTAPRVQLVKYDPIANRHCLFIEDNKRKIRGSATNSK